MDQGVGGLPAPMAPFAPPRPTGVDAEWRYAQRSTRAGEAALYAAAYTCALLLVMAPPMALTEDGRRYSLFKLAAWSTVAGGAAFAWCKWL